MVLIHSVAFCEPAMVIKQFQISQNFENEKKPRKRVSLNVQAVKSARSLEDVCRRHMSRGLVS